MNIKGKFLAALMHLTLSFLVLIALLFLVWTLWYPGIYIKFGAYQGFKIILLVDLVLGPLLTFIVFDKKKKYLLVDLFIIAAIQVSALMYGLSAVYSERPCLQVLTNSGVYIHTLNECDAFKMPQEFMPDTAHPKSYYLDLPPNEGDIAVIKFATEFADEMPVTLRSDLYENTSSLKGELFDFYLVDREFVSKLDCYVVPVVVSSFSGEACLNLSSGRLLEINK